MYKAVLLYGFYFLNCWVNSFLVNDGLLSTQTKYGDIQGSLVSVHFDGKNYQVRKFLGIPYAKPPVGDLRFRKPEMITALPSSPFKALKLGPVCPQTFARHLGLTSSEDCLYLNVFAPPTDTQTQKPVMVWIHGGAFTLGFSNVFDGGIISAFTDVIIVTINYRLGPLGFFSTNDAESPGNYALWDQRLAIQWVSENIAAFGGDSTNITIFGESAGGSSVVFQTLYPGNKGLFKRAIAESGTVAAWGVNRYDTNHRASINYAHYAGCNNSSTSQLLQCLRNKSTNEIRIATEEYQIKEPRIKVNKTWVPVYDGEFVLTRTDQLLSHVLNTNTTSKFTTFHDIDLMIGTTNDDGSVFLNNWLLFINQSSYGPLNSEYGVTPEQFEKVVVPIAAEMWLGEIPKPYVLDAINYEYTAWDDPANLTRRLQLLVDMCTHSCLNAPSITTANAHVSSNTSTYVYQFSTAPPINILTLPPMLKTNMSAGHADDIGFVFGFTPNLYVLNVAVLSSITAEQIRVSKAVMSMWSNFAKTGDPNGPMNLDSMYNNLQWPAYDRTNQIYLDITPNMGGNSAKCRLRAHAVEFWNNVLPKLQSLGKQ